MYLQDLFDCAVDIIFTRGFGVEYLDRKGATGNCEAWSSPIEVRELHTGEGESDRKDFKLYPTFSEFMVADVTISFRSLLRERTSISLIKSK